MFEFLTLRKAKNRSGFTLIELLVVIAIIGLLASIVLVSLNSARRKSRDARRVADISQIQTAIELYFSTLNTYPATGIAALETALEGNNCGGAPCMSQVPTPPTGAGETTYTYTMTASPLDYVLRAILEERVTGGPLDNDSDAAFGTTVCTDAAAPYYYCVRP